MNFKSLTKLQDQKYCENMVILTSDIIQKNFNDMEITYLAQRTKNGVEINELTKDNVIFVDKDQLKKYDVSTPLAKKRICTGIAKFYIKIAHLFSAIIMTINPVYTYKDDYGNTVKKTIMEKETIPLNAKDRRVSKKGICANRVEALTRGQDFQNIPEDGNIVVQPNICNMNDEPKHKPVYPYLVDPSQHRQPIQISEPRSESRQNNIPSQSIERIINFPRQDIFQKGGSEIKSLKDEPGIPELFHLYLDKYDYQTGTFNDMSEETKQIYFNDLQKFYTSFTGDPSMPENIRKFSDIKLRDYNKTRGCASGELKKPVKGSLKDYLFQKYALNLKNMTKKANDKQESLLEIINSIFTYDLVDGVKKIRIHPKLTELGLQKLVEQTRKIIVDLYITCENDFVEGVKIYEAIVENQIRLTTESQIQYLESSSKQLFGFNK